MSYLLDTHAWLWARSNSSQLGPKTRVLLGSPRARIFLSAVAAWEIAIKWRLGKLELPRHPLEMVQDSLTANALTPLPVKFEHACLVADLADHHQDPFDRLLVAQAIVEGLELITSDAILSLYPIRVHWASD
ncbi:type II toxin-antitoxin system VapC family toxin [bacterium CPR1]|nr:type II toxin-antitoxin system VapC family toxin [bacterium CPR1]